MFNPASRQMSTSRLASFTSVAPHALNSAPAPPNVPVPKLSAGTFNPELPSCRYSIISHYHSSDRSFRQTFAPGASVDNISGQGFDLRFDLLAVRPDLAEKASIIAGRFMSGLNVCTQA